MCIPTDEQTIVAEMKRDGLDPVLWLPWELRVRELENEGMTRSDAQSIADMEGLGWQPHMAKNPNTVKGCLCPTCREKKNNV